jgi:hypothetical protein
MREKQLTAVLMAVAFLYLEPKPVSGNVRRTGHGSSLDREHVDVLSRTMRGA